MKKSDINLKKGFTIIEVVLVLAVAGLIFLMAFVALPSMQRGQRDTQRRSDMSRFISQLSYFQANNNGKLPHTTTTGANATDGGYGTFITDYLLVGGDTFADPSTKDNYAVVYKGTANKDGNAKPQAADLGQIWLYTSATCNGEDVISTTGKNQIAISVKLEGAGWYCGHN